MNLDIFGSDCPICGGMMEWHDCEYCEDGLIDESEDDPINFAPGVECSDCQECHGHGGYIECSSLPHSQEQMKAYREQQDKEDNQKAGGNP